MLRRTEGIVLKTTPFGEADLIVTYLTPDFGILKTFAKSPRKIKSRFGSSLEPLTQSRISFWDKETSNLPRLTQSDIICSFQSIRNTFNCYLKVLEIIELTLHFVPERDANCRVYYLLLNSLQAIENNSSSFSQEGKGRLSFEDLIVTHYKVKFLKLNGYSPKLDACGRCGKRGNCFYVSHGSILCEDCAKSVDSPIKISPALAKIHADLLSWDISKINRIRPPDKLLSELSVIINMHVKYILAKPLKAETFSHAINTHYFKKLLSI
ncbi:MAG: DNA repair protein RecO [Nitrospirota bacterium]